MSFKYRKEIDGLRSLAVIPVVLFHAGFSLFGGGFTGVDIFFVISGYLITSLIVLEQESGNFTLTNFYERRARRILPALFFVVMLSMPLAYITMTPEKLKEFSNSVISIPIFLSNFLFWTESGYFATIAEEKPLLHTWSLAVEEQYYLLFPIFIIIFWNLGKKFLVTTISIIALVSLLLAQLGANLKPSPPYIDDVLRFFAVPDYAFFLSPTRAWELLAGSLTAFYLLKERRFNAVVNQVFSVTGFLLIFGSFFAFDKTTPFPSIYTLIPIIGTVLLIIFTTQGTIVYKILTNASLVFIGLISYSVYLWHVPLFAYTRLFTIDHPSNLLFIIMILASFILGYLNWRFIEAPFRNKNLFNRKQIFSISLFSGLMLIVIGIIGNQTNGFENRFSKEQIRAIQPEKFTNKHCNWIYPIKEYPRIEICELGDHSSIKKPIIFYGDSHTDALTTVLNNELQNKKLKGKKVYNNYCEPIVGIYRLGYLNKSVKNKCEKANEFLMLYLQEEDPEYIVLLNRWTFRMFPIENIIEDLTFNNQEGGKEYIKNHREFYVALGDRFTTDGDIKKLVLQKFIHNFLEIGLKVKLVYPIPESGWNISKYNMNKLIYGNQVPDRISTNYELYLKRHKFILEIFDNIEFNENLTRVKPSEVFCNTFIKDRCATQIEKIPLYYDSDHLSNAGANYLVDKILNEH